MFTRIKLTTDFWDQIFLLNISKMKAGYGWRDSPEIKLKNYDGWFIYFFPYLAFDATGYERNENYYVFAKENKILSRNYSEGYTIDKFSHTFNEVDFILNEKNLLFVGGLIGVDKDEKNNDALTPIFGYAVTELNENDLKKLEV